MHWLKRLLGFKEPESFPVSDAETIITGGHLIEKSIPIEHKVKFANACEENAAFIDEHWDLYPDCVKEHILNYREIDKLEKLYDRYEVELRGNIAGMSQYLELAREAKYLEIQLPGTEKIIAEYDAKIQSMRERINALPGTSHLREANLTLEKRASDIGWVCWYGTGGLHWNKKGVVQDGSGIYERRS
jgi:hypothetical protein